VDDLQDDLCEDLYDDVTVTALDRYGRQPRHVPAEVAHGWRRSVGGAAFLTAAMLGVRDVLEPEVDQAVVEEIDLSGLVWRDAPVLLDFVPDAPRLTRCRVRPWLL
jgi:hypothetical protein